MAAGVLQEAPAHAVAFLRRTDGGARGHHDADALVPENHLEIRSVLVVG